jgi:polyphosphate kinase 2 (PPK2 family)
MTERKYWKQYMKAYEACMSATSTKESPWYVVPADDKKDAQLIVSQILLDTLGKLKLRYPEMNPQERQQLKSIRKMLEK